MQKEEKMKENVMEEEMEVTMEKAGNEEEVPKVPVLEPTEEAIVKEKDADLRRIYGKIKQHISVDVERF